MLTYSNELIPRLIPPQHGGGLRTLVTIQNWSGTELREHPRKTDGRANQQDRYFLSVLITAFNDQPFQRRNLDAYRIGVFFNREILPAKVPFDRSSDTALLRIDMTAAKTAYPELFV